MNIELKLRDNDTKLMPYRENDTDAGFDLRANISEPVTVQKGGKAVKIPTGVIVNFPNNIYSEIFPRSGTGGKGLNLMNQTGIIDPGYRGEIQLKLFLNPSSPLLRYTIEPYERVVQMVFKEVLPIEIELVSWDSEFEETTRMDSGFGDSGRI